MVSGRNSGELCSLSSPGLGSWAGAQGYGKSHVVFKLSETKKIIRPVVRMTRHCLGDPGSPGSGNHPPGEPEHIYPLVTSRLKTEGVSRAPLRRSRETWWAWVLLPWSLKADSGLQETGRAWCLILVPKVQRPGFQLHPSSYTPPWLPSFWPAGPCLSCCLGDPNLPVLCGRPS